MFSEKNTFEFLYEALALKSLPRTGWIFSLAPPESVASHSFGTALCAMILARMEGLSEKKESELVRLALLHDIHEIRTGDISKKQKHYVIADAKRAEKDIFAGTPLSCESTFLADENLLVLLHDADRMDLLLWAIQSFKSGNQNMKEFISFALSEIKSKSGKNLARIALDKIELATGK